MADLSELWRDELQQPTNEPGSGDRADVIAAAYDELGLWSPEQREAAPKLIRASLGELATIGGGLQMETYMPIPLNNTFGLGRLINAYDNLPAKTGYFAGGVYVDHSIWNQFVVAELGLPEARGARGMVLGNENNDYNESGLYFTEQVVSKQRKNAAKRISELNENIELDASVLDPAGWLALNAIRRFEGKPLLDKHTFTRFTSMPEKSADGGSLVPSADGGDGLLELYGSYGYARSYVGVRLSVGQKRKA